jgi:cytochrome P450
MVTDGDRANIVQFPILSRHLFDPPPEYAELRAQCPVSPITLPNGRSGMLVTRHEDVNAILRDARFSANTKNANYPEAYGARRSTVLVQRSFVAMDRPEHDRQRKMISRFFTRKYVESLRTDIRSIIDETLGVAARMPQPVDLVSALALPVPIGVLCRLLGIPASDAAFVSDRTRRRLNLLADEQDVIETTADLQSYVVRLIEDTAPEQDNVVSALKAELAAGSISLPDAVDMVQLVLTAGHETTANATGLGIALLLLHPDQLARIRMSPDLAARAVQEILRYVTINRVVAGRVAMEDIWIGQILIPSGCGVRAIIASANRDPEVFDNPQEFDIARDNRRSLAFGGGIHVCLGEFLAEVEIEETLLALFGRYPDLELAVEASELNIRKSSGVHGLEALPVRLGTAQP